MGILDKARAAYAAGQKEAQEKEEKTQQHRQMVTRAKEVRQKLERRMSEEEERQHPSRAGRLVGAAAYHGSKAVERGAYYGGKAVAVMDQLAPPIQRPKSPPKERIAPMVSRHPTDALSFFAPQRERHPTGKVKKAGRTRSRSKRDIYSVDLDYIL